MSLITEFKEFAMRGNVIDLAVGVVIGAAFGKIVSAFVDAVIMPVLGALTSGVTFSELAWNIGSEASPVLIKYGVMLQALIDFTIIAFVIFMAIKAINRFKTPPPPPAPAGPTPTEVLLTEIRDLLKKG